MDVILQTNTENPRLALLEVKRFRDDSGYSSTLSVLSGGYSATYRFSFEEYSLSEFIASLSKIQELLTGVARLKPMWEPQYIELEASTLGHILVRGELPEHSARRQKLVFEFVTDQTCLMPLISALKSMQALTPD